MTAGPAAPAIASTVASTVLRTERLTIRHMAACDAAFMLDLLNDEAWLRFIGDRGVQTLDDARHYILNGPAEMVGRLGFGLYIVAQTASGCPVGVCGLAKRDFLDDDDVGYAFAPAYRGQGYAHEAAQAVLSHAVQLGFKRIAATVRPENAASIGLLGKLGLRFERTIERPGDVPDLQLFAIALA